MYSVTPLKKHSGYTDVKGKYVDTDDDRGERGGGGGGRSVLL